MTEQVTEKKLLESSQASLLSEFGEQYSRIMRTIMKAPDSPDAALYSMGVGTLFTKAVIGNGLNAERLLQTNTETMKKYTALSEYVLKKSQGSDTAPVATPESGDMRFSSPEWSENLWFDAMKQSYLIGSEYLENLFGQSDNLDSKEARKLEFYTRQWIDSLSPTNFPLTNPDVLKQARETEGESLVKGLRNFADDLESGRGVKMVESSAFELGRNIATTLGKVVARNRLAELIQYAPTSKEVHATPIMIIPPWINKYYILDLSPKNSFISWLVGQGYTVFVISWVNPDKTYQNTSYDDYMELGPLWGAQTIRSITEEKKINAVGYCLGGTLLASLLGYLASADDQENFIDSATFLTTMIDFSEPGDLGVFVDETSVSQLEKNMEETGYLDGKSMASTFSMMRSNDLIWHFVINNYLLGKNPGNFDLLYWNSDSTRLPAEMHSYYLRKMYIENLLCKPEGLSVLGVPIDLSKVKAPVFFISTQQDHISPWQSTYAGAKLFSGKVRFLLGQSGHIAGVINPPSKNKYGYWTSTKFLTESPQQWLESANRREGSWWPEWEGWIKGFSGEQVAAREPGNQTFKALADAPGSYVKM